MPTAALRSWAGSLANARNARSGPTPSTCSSAATVRSILVWNSASLRPALGDRIATSMICSLMLAAPLQLEADAVEDGQHGVRRLLAKVPDRPVFLGVVEAVPGLAGRRAHEHDPVVVPASLADRDRVGPRR